MRRPSSGFLIGILAAVLVGCGRNADQPTNRQRNGNATILVEHVDGDESELPEGFVRHRSRDPDAPARVDRTPVVIDDPAEIERCKRIFEQRIADLYKEAVSRISRGEWVYTEHKLALKARMEATRDLRRMTSNESLAATSRTQAAKTLITLEDTAGEEFLLEMLNAKSPDMRLAALESLCEWDVEMDVSTPARSEGVLSLLKDLDERVVQAAAKLCTHRKVPDTEARLVALLERGRLKNAGPVAEELAEVATTPRAVDALLPYVFGGKTSEFDWGTAYTLSKLIDRLDADVVEPVRTALYEYTLSFEDDRYDQTLVDHLARSAGQDAIPILNDIWKNADDTVSRTYAVRALARLQPERAIDLLTVHIRREGARSHIVRLLQQYATEDDFERIATLLMESFQASGRPFDQESTRLFLLRFGDRGEEFIREHIDQLDDDARMWAAWKLEGLNLATALSELHEAGVIQAQPDDLIKKMQEERRHADDPEPLDTSEPHTLIEALSRDGIVTMFDAETGMIPCDHDHLILQFAEGSRGRFSPQWPIQLWHQANPDDYNGPYTVQFVSQNRVFRIGAENYGDWYDVEAVVRVINSALTVAGRSERFVTLDSDGQLAAFVFADPKAFLPIVEKYQLPLSDDASQAMRDGLEFERHVIESSQ